MATCQYAELYRPENEGECRQIISWPSQIKLCDKHMAEAPPVPIAFKPVNLIWEHDFSRLVTQVYGKPYCFQQQGEKMGQDTLYKFEVDPPEELTDEVEAWATDMITEWLQAEPPPERESYISAETGQLAWKERPKNDFETRLWWLRDNYPQFDAIIIDLRRRGLIEPGEYALHVWW